MHDVNMKLPRRRKAPHSRGSLRTRAYEYLRSQILNGHLRGGTAISEVDISQEIATSRGPVREAIGQLVAEGLIERIPGRGTMVSRTERADIVNLYELREALEVYAVGKVARLRLDEPYRPLLLRLTEDVRALAEELRDSEQERLDEVQMQRFVAADMGFHTLLLQAAGNDRIARVVSETHVLTRIFSYRREGHNARLLEGICGYHREILEAIEAGDVRKAMETIGKHIRESMVERLETYDRWDRQHEMNRIIPLPTRILEELDRMRFGAQEGEEGGQGSVARGRQKGKRASRRPGSGPEGEGSR